MAILTNSNHQHNGMEGTKLLSKTTILFHFFYIIKYLIA
jgi:hypothetical protein